MAVKRILIPQQSDHRLTNNSIKMKDLPKASACET